MTAHPPQPESELLLCPFCGGEAELDTRQGYAQFPPNGRGGTRVTVYCRDCGADLGVCREDVPSIEPEQVVEMWNRRASVKAQPVADVVLLAGKVASCREREGHGLPDGWHTLYAGPLLPRQGPTLAEVLAPMSPEAGALFAQVCSEGRGKTATRRAAPPKGEDSAGTPPNGVSACADQACAPEGKGKQS